MIDVRYLVCMYPFQVSANKQTNKNYNISSVVCSVESTEVQNIVQILGQLKI